MAAKKFRAEIWRPEGVGTSFFITVPFSVERVWGTRARVAVKGTVNGFAFRSSVMPYGDGHHLSINKEMREGAGGVSVGDEVDVVLERDEAPRIVEPPPELAALLPKNKAAKATWDKLPPSHRKEYAAFISEAKKEETRQRRAEKSVELLTQGRRVKE
jgi:Domain of unknown function (DUF1905)/Bacteriocin-protection, YdeI or OmpD-Associated